MVHARKKLHLIRPRMGIDPSPSAPHPAHTQGQTRMYCRQSQSTYHCLLVRQPMRTGQLIIQNISDQIHLRRRAEEHIILNAHILDVVRRLKGERLSRVRYTVSRPASIASVMVGP